MTKQDFDPNGLAGRSSFKGLHPFAIWYDTSNAPTIFMRFNTGNGRYITLGSFDDTDPLATFRLADGLVETNTITNASMTLDISTHTLTLTDSEDNHVEQDLSALAVDTNTTNVSMALDISTHTLTLTDSEDNHVDQDLSALANRESFERVSSNLASWASVASRDDGGALASITYTNGVESITKALNRDDAAALVSVVLSGDTPGGISLTKTISRDANGAFAGTTYS